VSEDYRQTLLVCSTLLRYPDEGVIRYAQQLTSFIEELPLTPQRLLKKFLSFLETTDIVTLQELYVSTFDLSDENSLYITYATLKDDSARGSELQRLKSLYRSTGFSPTTEELPDYLPMFLEYIGMSGADGAKQLLHSYAPLIADLAIRLERKGNPYALVVQACSEVLRNIM